VPSRPHLRSRDSSTEEHPSARLVNSFLMAAPALVAGSISAGALEQLAIADSGQLRLETSLAIHAVNLETRMYRPIPSW
jgi:hypothetical protein